MNTASIIRDCTYDDLPWMVEVAEEAYRGLVEDFHPKAAAIWGKACIDDKNTIVLRGATHVGCAYVTIIPWAPKHKSCDLVYLYGRKGRSLEALHIVSALNERRKALGCSFFLIGSIYNDLSPIAKRLGGRPLNALWIVE